MEVGEYLQKTWCMKERSVQCKYELVTWIWTHTGLHFVDLVRALEVSVH